MDGSGRDLLSFKIPLFVLVGLLKMTRTCRDNRPTDRELKPGLYKHEKLCSIRTATTSFYVFMSMAYTRFPKHALNYKPRGRRDRGRPRKRWQRADTVTGQRT